MTTTVNLRPILDRKQWEMCNFCPVSTAIGSFVVSSNLRDQYQYYFTSATTLYIYDPINDAWMMGASPALNGTFGAGSCGVRHPFGPRGFPTAGTTTTIVTTLNLQRSLENYAVRIIAGPNAGTEVLILSNTTGPNSTITVATAFGTAITVASEFILITGRVWVVNAGLVVAGSFKYYDLATNVWNTVNQANLPASIATDARMVVTPGLLNNFVVSKSSAAGTTTTLVDTTRAWGVNNWVNYQVRITGGTGAGQFRPIASNTATALTVAVAWTIVPDATSTYVLEGNDDNIYWMGNAAITTYRYSISANTWTVLAPTVARAGPPIAGMSGHWVYQVSDQSFNQAANFQNGQYIYSFRGNSVTLDRYNIVTNTWDNDVVYAPKMDSFISGTSWNYATDYIYAMLPTGRVLKYNVAEQRIEPSSQLWYAQGTIHQGDRFFDVTYTDGATKIRWLYYLTHSQNMLFRMLLF